MKKPRLISMSARPATTTSKFDAYQEMVKEKTLNFLAKHLPTCDGIEASLYEAMRYSTLSNGKCLRPFLIHACADLFGAPEESKIRAGAAVEALHTYTLIHDDLPSMDNDDIRRGKPSCHIAFNEATAILAGNSLYGYAIELLLARETHPNNDIRMKLAQHLLSATGAHGTVAGQVIDLMGEKMLLTLDEVEHLHRLKTGMLIAVSCQMGAIIGEASLQEQSRLVNFGFDVGLAFQIIDDVLDVTGDPTKLGKPILSDQNNTKSTFVTLLGLEQAKKYAHKKASDAVKHLEAFGSRAGLLRDLANYVIMRDR